ncbi:hypothetical protein [Gimesia sp.]|uniref:hypothetical protein n=1 Tax=Gimesia sp. TaxID=2024833 RepID=UPI003A933D95
MKFILTGSLLTENTEFQGEQACAGCYLRFISLYSMTGVADVDGTPVEIPGVLACLNVFSRPDTC